MPTLPYTFTVWSQGTTSPLLLERTVRSLLSERYSGLGQNYCSLTNPALYYLQRSLKSILFKVFRYLLQMNVVQLKLCYSSSVSFYLFFSAPWYTTLHYYQLTFHKSHSSHSGFSNPSVLSQCSEMFISGLTMLCNIQNLSQSFVVPLTNLDFLLEILGRGLFLCSLEWFFIILMGFQLKCISVQRQKYVFS